MRGGFYMDIKIRLRVYLVAAWALMTAETKEEKQEILKILNEFEKKIGDD
jgi:hypothetical protein